MSRVIVATKGNFASNLNAALGTAFEEINFDDKEFPNPRNEPEKSERNVEKVSALGIKFAIVDGNNSLRTENLERLAQNLVDKYGVKWVVIAPIRSLINLPHAVWGLMTNADSDIIKKAATETYHGFLADRLGIDPRVQARLVAEAFGLLWPAWLRRDGRVTERFDTMLSCRSSSLIEAWGVWESPSGGIRECLRLPAKIYIYTQDKGQPWQPPIGIPAPQPVPQPWPGPATSPQPTPQLDQQKILLIGGIALLALMGIILIASN
jgi:hypothetical protein